MDTGICNTVLFKQLLHKKNKCMFELVSSLQVKNRRKLFTSVRKLNNPLCSTNFIFLQHHACTLAEFCVIHVIINDGRRKISKPHEEQNINKKIKHE
jgi:ABC-type sugar transport system ATPase subunit